MDVFLVPLGRRGYELYCEGEDQSGVADAASSVGVRRRVSRFFRKTLAFLEQERQDRLARRAAKEHRTVSRRVRDRVLGWMAERVAEQRLLWQLRHAVDTTAHYPGDISADEAERIVARSLRQDATRHLRWGSVNLAGAALFVPFTFVPGPNLPAYYFWFRVVGHTLSYFGARHGLTRVSWRYVPSQPLAELRGLARVTGDDRVTRARDLAQQLGLTHLEAFVERLLLGAA